MAIRKKIKIQKGRAASQLLPEIQAAVSTIVKGQVVKEDMELYICSGPPDLRTLSQNAYYWGVVIKTISDHIGDHPHDVHGWYKKTFAVTFREYNGIVYEDSKSTGEMHKKEFMDYVEMIRMHALEEHGLDIPLPQEVPDHVYVEHINAGMV